MTSPQTPSRATLDSVAWRVSTHSGNGGDCVEVGPIDDGSGRVAVRHSHDPQGPAIVYTSAEWAAFTAGVRDGEFDFTA